MGIVYSATNKINGKKYIGKTVMPLRDRVTKHFSNAKKKNSKFQNALRKYGKDGFVWTTLFESDSNDELCGKEQLMIKTLDSISKGYNITFGGEGALGRKPWNKGKAISEETRKKISDNRKGIPSQFREVVCVETQEVFHTLKDAADKYNTDKRHIYRCCRGIRQTTAGYHWQYVGKVG